MSNKDIDPKLIEELYKSPGSTEEPTKQSILQELVKNQQRKAGILTTLNIKERLLQLLEEAKEPTTGAGRTEYTIDGLRLYDLIKGFASAL